MLDCKWTFQRLGFFTLCTLDKMKCMGNITSDESKLKTEQLKLADRNLILLLLYSKEGDSS